MKEEHERASEAQKQKEKEKYEEHIRYQQELERQLEVTIYILMFHLRHSYGVVVTARHGGQFNSRIGIDGQFQFWN